MLTLLLWRFICAHIIGGHTRDWHAYDAMGLSRCLHCRREMTPPPLARRERL